RVVGSGRGSLGHHGGRIAYNEVVRPAPNLAALLADDAASCRRQYAGPAVTLAADTTLDEVVDVVSRSPAGKLVDCLVEAAWALRLPADFRGHRALSVVFDL